jgi:hypothetical protein
MLVDILGAKSGSVVASQTVQNNVELFNFSGGDKSTVSLEKVRALYSDLQSSGLSFGVNL